jgi:hypothetical protein
MNLASRLQAQLGWTSSFRTVYKKPAPRGFKVPQTTGILGWIILSYEKNIPTCTWITARDTISIPIVFDERFFGDTIFRAEKISKDTFVISDIIIHNSNYIFACSTFEQRYDWLINVLERFHSPIDGLSKLIHKSALPKTSLRGYEVYTDTPGTNGFFVENDKQVVTKGDMPDVYHIEDSYVRVPDLKTSVFLRSKGPTFELSCVKESDGSWTIRENIPDLK